eukprot:gnl/TRDRNA2_/TRDRNA2_147620_c0_seq2.p1 gnl/TRDRNA2_/TRDRNA2_147620_c0~~gnl/TRDRNA2_/TRDRNA2_147620_c0_seq2.p1  ORF type:complete len:211 (+),score=17.56 gnl/TRDRNA2_/TRDRNA2_147620_c0_seq2:88-720(+)
MDEEEMIRWIAVEEKKDTAIQHCQQENAGLLDRLAKVAANPVKVEPKHSVSMARFCHAYCKGECQSTSYCTAGEKSLRRRGQTFATMPGEPKQFAIFVMGLLDRYYPFSTLKHVVKPAVQAGLIVDYHAMVSQLPMKEGAFGAYWYGPVPNPWVQNKSMEEIRHIVARHAVAHGARRVVFHLTHIREGIDPLPDPRHGSDGSKRRTLAEW